MSKQTYECMFLVDPNRFARDTVGVPRKIGEMIEKCGGEVLVSRLWSEQKLAYPINGHKKGVYWMTYYLMEASRDTELRRATQLNTDILRAMVVKLDPRIAGVMVEHAKTSKPSVPSDSGPDRGFRPPRNGDRAAPRELSRDAGEPKEEAVLASEE